MIRLSSQRFTASHFIIIVSFLNTANDRQRDQKVELLYHFFPIFFLYFSICQWE